MDSSVFSGKGVVGWGGGERQGIRTSRLPPLFSQTSASPSLFNFGHAQINIRNFLVATFSLQNSTDPFDAAKITLPAAISPTAAQIIPFLPLGK